MDFIVSTTKEALIDEVDDEYFVIQHSYEYINEVLVVNQALDIGDIANWEDNILAFWHVPIVETKSVLIQGININRDVNATVVGHNDFKISLSPDGNFTNSLTIPLNQARIGAYLYIKFKASAAGPRQATIVLSSPGAENVEVLLSGQGLAA